MSREARPVGRRPGDPEETRESILTAARRCFAESGFERATIRAIAERADVDPALVMHYFRTKKRLFAAAHRMPADPEIVIAQLAELDLDQRARAMTRFYFANLLSDDAPPLSLIRAAATNEQAATMLREFITSTLLASAPDLAPGPDAERRLSLVGAHLLGVAFGRQILAIGPLADSSVDDLVDLVAPTIRSYLDVGSPTPSPAHSELQSEG